MYLFDAAGGRSRWSKLLGEITADCRGTVRCTGLLAPRRRFRWNISRFDQARAGASYKSIELKDEFIMQNPSIDDLGVPPFQETSICGFLVDFPEQKQSNEGLTTNITQRICRTEIWGRNPLHCGIRSSGFEKSRVLHILAQN